VPRRLTPEDLARAERARINLLRFRRELGFSAAVVADRAGLPIDTYRQLEKGARRLTNVNVLMHLSSALGHTVEDFFAANPPPHRPERLALVAVRVLPGATLDADLWAELSAAAAAVEHRQRARDGSK